ncbi:hypothetical protein Zmor_005335 [Zophobas morio]|uniref:Uncharacterized protein n=1 Tax=Zophobas morio TaxID=2755281 RepID=A0AA38MM69_9CUCU|nr:hypothetical protein Zmor_005335 [Zophobas morio]
MSSVMATNLTQQKRGQLNTHTSIQKTTAATLKDTRIRFYWKHGEDAATKNRRDMCFEKTPHQRKQNRALGSAFGINTTSLNILRRTIG